MPSLTSTSSLRNVLFVPHGAPTFALNPGAAGAAMRQVAQQLPTPRAVVVVSPHWETALPTVGLATQLETIHDFHGFPASLYDIHYPATGCPEAAREVVAALKAHGFEVQTDPQRGLDHGAWIPLRQMFPDADVPVIPLSVQSHAGRTLAYVQVFADWLVEHLAQGDLDSLLNYRQHSPEGVRAHPSEEHLLPLFTALGAAGPDAVPQAFHRGISDCVIAMDGYAFQSLKGKP